MIEPIGTPCGFSNKLAAISINFDHKMAALSLVPSGFVRVALLFIPGKAETVSFETGHNIDP
jgi:hypothetical protein